MNERIKKFEKQCWDHQTNHVDSKKFAELIAKEYIEICRDMFIVGSVSWNLLNEKLEHFGD